MIKEPAKLCTCVLVAPISATKSSLPKTSPSIVNGDLSSNFLAAMHICSSCSRERADSTNMINPTFLSNFLLSSKHELNR